MAQITYADKVALYENNDIADINKVKADDMNEIKASVNNNDDMLNGNAVAGSMVVDGIRTKNMFDKNAIVEKLTYSDIGTTTTLTDTFVQYTYIPVEPNTEYIFSMGQAYTSTNNRLTICEYDSSKTFIQRNIITPSLDPSGTGEKLVITTTSTTAYVRLSSIIIALNDLQFEKGNERTTYTPFQNLNPDVSDTEWANATLSSAFQPYSSVYDNKYRRIGKMVFIQGGVKPTAEIAANTETTIFTLPEGFRPAKDVYTVCQGSSLNRWLLKASISGNVTINRYGTTTALAIPTNAYLVFSLVFAID